MSFTVLRVACYLWLLDLEFGIRHVFCPFSGRNVWIMLHQLLYLAYSYFQLTKSLLTFKLQSSSSLFEDLRTLERMDGLLLCVIYSAITGDPGAFCGIS